MKTLSVRELASGVSQALHDVEDSPVLILNRNEPAAWIVSADSVARAADEDALAGRLYQHALQVVAAQLFDEQVLTMGQAAHVAHLSVSQFMELCARLEIPVIRESRTRSRDRVAAYESLSDEIPVPAEG